MFRFTKFRNVTYSCRCLRDLYVKYWTAVVECLANVIFQGKTVNQVTHLVYFIRYVVKKYLARKVRVPFGGRV